MFVFVTCHCPYPLYLQYNELINTVLTQPFRRGWKEISVRGNTFIVNRNDRWYKLTCK